MNENKMPFWPEYNVERKDNDQALYFVFYQNQLAVIKEASSIKLPYKKVGHMLISHLKNHFYLGELRGAQCFCGRLEEEVDLPEDLEWITLKDLRWEEDELLYFVAIKAMQLMEWDRNSQYCGKCGNRTKRKEDERAKVCEGCGKIEYPRISPAIIVGIKKGNEVLLAHNRNFRQGLYSIIAGFVEQGETLEMTVKREVLEEVGIRVKNIRYFQSKPWSSGDSLMLGFIADYESGEINIDGQEILDAGWYSKEKLPPVLPDPITTARHIIDYLLNEDV